MKPTLHKTKEYSKFPLSLPLKPIKLVIRSDEQDCGTQESPPFFTKQIHNYVSSHIVLKDGPWTHHPSWTSNIS